MKQGGQVIYAGPLGRHSQRLIDYFQAIYGVPNIIDGYNPATWMLEATSLASEAQLSVDFAHLYKTSILYHTRFSRINISYKVFTIFSPTMYSLSLEATLVVLA